MTVRILHGDCIANMKTLPDDSVHCVVTSPPYWGLRDYGTAKWEGGDPDCDHGHIRDASGSKDSGARQSGKAAQSERLNRDECRCGAKRVDGQIGLEQSPAEYLAKMVEVFREVRRVLRPDGTCWVNMGDCYATGAGKVNTAPGGGTQGERWKGVRGDDKLANMGPVTQPNRMPLPGLKPKDLVGMPWRLAFALQQPYYTGRIKDERDRIWLAAMIDAEGCFFIHKRKAGTPSGSKFTKADGTVVNYERTADTYGVGLEICNTSIAIIERIQQIVGIGTVTRQTPEQNPGRKQTIHRWRVQPNECKNLARELYPHFVAKRQQARLIYSCPSSGDAGAAVHAAMIGLHRGIPSEVDYPEPPSMFEPGWFLRQDVIWSKRNPMPESVRDRCTKAHEYIFLLAKSERYYFDAQAIAEPSVYAHEAIYDNGENGHGGGISHAGQGSSTRKFKKPGTIPSGWDTGAGNHHGLEGRYPNNKDPKPRAVPSNAKQSDDANVVDGEVSARMGRAPGWRNNPDAIPITRNKRSVWTITTKPFSEAHFATFPPGLPEICIKAGSKPGDTILDPFFGAGTTGLVADRLGRDCIGIELNPEYAAMAQSRIDLDAKTTVRAQQPLFDEITA